MQGGRLIYKTKNKQQMKVRILITALVSCMICVSCSKYDDFTHDFDYTSTYFAYQNPVRTVFSDNLEIEIGAMMGGKRKSKSEETVSYRIAPELLEDAEIVGKNKFTLLPADYYSLSSKDKLIIPKGEFLGKTKLTLDGEKFLNDPHAINKYYALPLLITETSLDSVLIGNANAGIPRKDYTIVVIKFISKYHGIYYHRGQRAKYDADGTLVDVLRYVTEDQEEEFIENVVWDFSTLSANTMRSNGVGENYSTSSKKYALDLSVANDNKVAIKGVDNSLIPVIKDLGTSIYEPGQKKFYLNYEYSDAGFKYVMKDTLTFRNDGLKLELW